jgi:dihydrofolate reductase
MTIISLIAAVDENFGLGVNNQLLCHLPADLKHFKQLTLGKPVIMGRKTFDSIGRPLPGRLNIVLSKSVADIEGVIVVNSLQKALDQVILNPEVMIIGGALIFEQALPLAQRIYLTIIKHTFNADVFFPNLDTSSWVLSDENHFSRDDKNLYDMTFFSFERSLPRKNK